MYKIGSEILAVIDAMAEEKSIAKNLIIASIEDAFAKMASVYYGNDGDVITKMNLNNGEINFFQKKIVKDKPTMLSEISFKEAKNYDNDAVVDGFVVVPLPTIPMQRLSAIQVKRSILDSIRSAEKQMEYDEFKKREGEIIVGVVKKASPINLIVGLGPKAEGIIFREGLLRADSYKAGDKIKAYIKEVKRSDYDCQVILSRTDNNFLAMLIAENVVEVQDGMIEIKSISRAPGEKSKVAVISSDSSLDSVGACIGARGSRIKPIVDELRGERVDIVYYDNDLINFAKNAITPSKVLYGNFSDESNSVELVIPDDQIKLAIGKGGQNVRLASQLVGCNITVVAESEKKKADQEAFARKVNLMATSLDLEESVAQFLISSGINTPADLVSLGAEKLVKSGVFTEEIANELVSRADEFVKETDKKNRAELAELGVSNDILQLDGMTTDYAVALGKNGVKTVQDVADLSSDEFIEYCGEHSASEANRAIMQARHEVYGI